MILFDSSRYALSKYIFFIIFTFIQLEILSVKVVPRQMSKSNVTSKKTKGVLPPFPKDLPCYSTNTNENQVVWGG